MPIKKLWQQRKSAEPVLQHWTADAMVKDYVMAGTIVNTVSFLRFPSRRYGCRNRVSYHGLGKPHFLTPSR